MIKKDRYHQFVWCLYDWAHTVWPVLIITFVFPNYFTQNVAATPLEGSVYWGHALTISGILTAILAPITGLIADTLHNTSFWFRTLTIINIICAFLLWYVLPDSSYVLYAISVIIIGSLAFELSTAFYNTYLTDIAEPDDISKISGVAWGVGYFAGIICLVICLMTLVLPKEPLFGLLSTQNAANIRAIGPIIGTWYLIFSIPMLCVSSPKKAKSCKSLSKITSMAYQQLIHSVQKSKSTSYIYYYLIVRMIYTDGINTLFAFAGIYAASTYNMGFEDIMYFAIACNLSAGLGCFLGGWSDSNFGEQRTLQFSLTSISILTTALLLVNNIVHFWILALIATLFVGPIQSSSRSLMAKICPEESKGEFFGLYALSGRITSFLGPMLLTYLTQVSQSQAVGMSAIVFFFAIGTIGMFILRIPRHLVLTLKPE